MRRITYPPCDVQRMYKLSEPQWVNACRYSMSILDLLSDMFQIVIRDNQIQLGGIIVSAEWFDSDDPKEYSTLFAVLERHTADFFESFDFGDIQNEVTQFFRYLCGEWMKCPECGKQTSTDFCEFGAHTRTEDWSRA